MTSVRAFFRILVFFLPFLTAAPCLGELKDADAPWPAPKHDSQRTNHGANPAPLNPLTVKWVYRYHCAEEEPCLRLSYQDLLVGKEGVVIVRADDVEEGVPTTPTKQRYVGVNPDGTEKWRSGILETSTANGSGPAMLAQDATGDVRIYLSAGDNDNRLYCLKGSDGTELRAPYASPLENTFFGDATPVVRTDANGKGWIYLEGDDRSQDYSHRGSVLVVDEDFTETRLSGTGLYPYSLDLTAGRGDPRIYIMGGRNRTYIIDSTGLGWIWDWSYSNNTESLLAVIPNTQGNTLDRFLLTRNGVELNSFDSNGGLLYTYQRPQPSWGYEGLAGGEDGSAYLVSQDSVDKVGADGNLVWSKYLPDNTVGKSILLDGQGRVCAAYYTTADSRLAIQCRNASDGSLIYDQSFPDVPAPTIFVLGDSQTFYVLGPNYVQGQGWTQTLYAISRQKEADLGIWLNRNDGQNLPVPQGGQVLYRVAVQNLGPDGPVDGEITLTVTPSEAVQSFILDQLPEGWSASPQGSHLNIRFNGLFPGDRNEILPSLQANPNFTGEISATATVLLSEGNADPTPGNNGSEPLSTTVGGPPDAFSTITGPGWVGPGMDFQIDVTWGNQGLGVSADTSLQVQLPDYLRIIDTGSYPGTYTISEDQRTIIWSLGDVAPGAENTFAVTGSSDAGTPSGTRVSVNTSISNSSSNDPPDNNQTQQDVTVTQQTAHLNVSFSVSPAGPVQPGDRVDYTVTVQNPGSDSLEEILFRTGFDGDIRVSEPIAESISVSAGNIGNDEYYISWSLRDFAVGQSATMRFSATVKECRNWDNTCSKLEQLLIYNVFDFRYLDDIRTASVSIECPALNATGRTDPFILIGDPTGKTFDIFIDYRNGPIGGEYPVASSPNTVLEAEVNYEYVSSDPPADQVRVRYGGTDLVWNLGDLPPAPAGVGTVRIRCRVSEGHEGPCRFIIAGDGNECDTYDNSEQIEPWVAAGFAPRLYRSINYTPPSRDDPLARYDWSFLIRYNKMPDWLQDLQLSQITSSAIHLENLPDCRFCTTSSDPDLERNEQFGGSRFTYSEFHTKKLNYYNWIKVEGSSPGTTPIGTLTQNLDAVTSFLEFTNEVIATGVRTEYQEPAIKTHWEPVPLIPPLIVHPGPGDTCICDGGLKISGVAQPGTDAMVEIKGPSDAGFQDLPAVTVGESGRFDTFFSPDARLDPGTYWVKAYSQYENRCSESSTPIEVRTANLAWDPQRSFWESVQTRADMPAAGNRFRFFFKKMDGEGKGTYSASAWKIPGFYGFWDTDLYIQTCGCPNDPTQAPQVRVISDNITYTPDSCEHGLCHISIGYAHDVHFEFLCGDNIYRSDGTVLIDPDGYVFDADRGWGHTVPGATVTCMWYAQDWGYWLAWPAQLYDQTNPQVTDQTGYFAFFTPPGHYYIDVRDPGGYQSWKSPVVEVISEIVHVNVPYAPAVPEEGAVRLRASLDGIFDQDGNDAGSVVVPAGSVVVWESALSGGGQGVDPMKLFDDPAVRIRSSVDPQESELGWDSGRLAPGARFARRFDAAGSYAYTAAAGISGTIVVTPLPVEPDQAALLTLDSDGDGVIDTRESGPDGTNPDYDGNNDGTSDRLQAGIVSFASCFGYLTMTTSAGAFSGAASVPNPSERDKPAGVSFPWCFYEFRIKGLEPGASADATIIFPSSISADAYYRYGPTPENPISHWYGFAFDAGTGIGAELQGNRVVLHLTDGRSGDDDLSANGVIVDAGGPGQTGFRSLAVLKQGTGEGTVRSDPSGIDCGLDCREAYIDGRTVSLSATAASGSFFQGWDGCDGTADCIVSMNGAKTVVAVFSRIGTASASNFDVNRGTLVNPTVPFGFTLDNAGGTIISGVNNGTILGGSFGGMVQNNGVISGGLTLLEGGTISGGRISGTLTGQGGLLVTGALFDVTAMSGVSVGYGCRVTQSTVRSVPGLDLTGAVTGADGAVDTDFPLLVDAAGQEVSLGRLMTEAVHDVLSDSTACMQQNAGGGVILRGQSLGDVVVPARIRQVVTTSEPDGVAMNAGGDLVVIRNGIAATLVPASADTASFQAALADAGCSTDGSGDGIFTVSLADGTRLSLRFSAFALRGATLAAVTAGTSFQVTGDPQHPESLSLTVTYPDGTTQTMLPFVHDLDLFRTILTASGADYRIDPMTGVISLLDANRLITWHGRADCVLSPAPEGASGMTFERAGDLNGDGLEDIYLVTETARQIIYSLP